MAEWPDNSRWTLTVNGTPAQMGPGTREWVRKTLAGSAFAHRDELRNIASLLSAQELGRTEEERLIKEEILAHFLNALDNPDLGKTLANAGGVQHIIGAMLGSRYTGVRRQGAQVFTSMSQNNPSVQSFAHGQGVLGGLLEAIEKERDTAVKEAYVSSISALVRGEFDAARREFVKSQGFDVIREVILEPVSIRIVKKALLLLINVFYYDRSDPSLQIFEEAVNCGFIPILFSMENHEDAEVRQMALQALHNLTLRGCYDSADIRAGLLQWQQIAQTQGDRPDEVAAIEETLRSVASQVRA